MNKKVLVSILVCFQAFMFITEGSWGQEKVIPLKQTYPANAAITKLKESVIEVAPNKRMIYNVFQPSLIYLPAKENISGTSVIIAPGGALQIISIDNEGYKVAEYLNKHGVDAFILKYSLAPTFKNPMAEINENFLSDEGKRDSMISTVIPYAMQDGLNAISYVREHASEYNLNPNRIGFMGFSAGGTVTMSVVYNCTKENRPNFIAPIYPWIGELGDKVPQEKTPAFVVVANDDNLKLVPQSLKIYNRWNEANQPVELHIFGKGGHGFGADRNYNSSDGWISQFVTWLGGEGFLWPEKPQGFFANIKYKDFLKMQEQQEEAMKNDWGNVTRYSKENSQLSSNDIKDKIVFYGNSITDFWIRFDKDFFEKNGFVDRGISGQTTSQMIVRFRQDVVNLKPSAVVILAGTNDIAGNTGPISLEDIFGNIVTMADIATANNIKPVICSVLPASHYSWNREIEPAGKIKKLNQMLKEYAENNHISYVDYYTPMVDNIGGLPEKYSADGVHPNIEGYKIMEKAVSAELVKDKLRNDVKY